MTQSKFALLILNGRPPSKSLISRFWNDAAIRICADGAFNILNKYHLEPEVILGDLDSFDKAIKLQSISSKLIHIPDQDTTDGEKAIKYCQEKNYKNIAILGALGKRSDHWLYNIGLLKHGLNQKLQVFLYGEQEKLFICDAYVEIQAKKGTIISIIPIYGEAYIESTSGLRYPMQKQKLNLGNFSSISNEFENNLITIKVAQGEVLISLFYPNS
jgi:thiamine pyrophosphokinase